MQRREFLKTACAGALALGPAGGPQPLVDPATAKLWLARWEKNILETAGTRYCDTETGEEIGWLMSPLHPMARTCRWSISNYLMATPSSAAMFIHHVASISRAPVVAVEPEVQNRLRLSRMKVTGP